MSKRVFELAKELNTTSKRLIEKLEEINIKVKSHMSLLEDDELDRLYKHIGVVNRSRVNGSDDGSITDQQDPVENQVRKTIPRIIRKTEIIIRDDDYEIEAREREKKKNKKSYVRTSSSTDGLMAGMQRGNDKHPMIRKHIPDQPQQAQEQSADRPSVKKKADEIKIPLDLPEDDIVGISQRGDRIRRPVDSILSIKKVSSRDEREKQVAGNADEKQDNTAVIPQKPTEISDRNQTANLQEEEPKDRKTIGIQKETVSAEAEKPEKNMVNDTQVTQQASAEKTVERSLAEAETARPDSQGLTKADDKKELSAREGLKKEDPKPAVKAAETKIVPEKSGEEQAKTTAPDSAKKIDHAGQGNRADKGQRPVQQFGGFQDKEQQNRMPRRNDRDSSSRGDRDNYRDGGQNRGIGRDAGTNRGPGREGGRPFNRDGQNRTGGEGFRKDGDFKPFNRDSGFNREKNDQGRGFDRNRDTGDQGYRGRSDDRNRSGNKPLVIPKVNIAPGLVEEKNNLRGERRSAITRDLEKGIKREAKKDIKTPVVSSPDKSKDKYKKSFVVGHTASVSDMYSDDFVLNEFYEEKERLKKDKSKRKEEKHIPPKAVLHEITIPETITVKNLAEALKKTAAEVIKKLMGFGIMATLNQELDFDTAAIVGDEFGVKVQKEIVITDEDILFNDMQDKEEDLVERAPVVVVMGHVDHGKTSLLDAIRKTNVVDREAGGITQHIGAYMVNIHGRNITFLDTPGHEAFTAMRARGAQVTDIAILVVAADDGVMPQTVEAINHAKAANVSMIVAINKIDKPGANPDRIKQELADRGVLVEEWGGDVIAVPVSAKKGTNIEQLLEMILLTADVMELKANPNRQAKGVIIEAKLDKGRGPVATALVQRGTLHAGDSIISGTTFGRIRAMTDENGIKIEAAGPSTPVEVIGLDEVPEAGDVFYAVSDEKVAKHLVEQRRSKQREQAIGTAPRVSLDALFGQIQQGEVKELNLIVKADVQGSVEAVKQSVEKLSNDEVKVQVIHGGVGAINEADVTLASVSNAIIIGFNVRPPANVVEAAEAAGVDIRLYRIIYNAIEDIEKAMKGLLAPTYKEVVDGHVEIRQTFKASNVGTIGGGYVTDGKIVRNSEVRVVRNGIVVYEGKLASLKRFKDDVREVAQGYECGILIEKFNDIKEGDVIEAFRMVEVQRT